MTLDFALLLDAVVAVLLVVTIIYATILNRKLSALRDAKAELQKQMAGFQIATEKTEAALIGLRQAAERAGKPLQGQIDQADSKFGDLKYLVDKADGIADRLEQAIGSARGQGPAAPVGAGSTARATPREGLSRRSGAGSPSEDSGGQTVSPGQADLIRALQGVR